MKYGLPYMGSKNKLALRILDCLPRGGTLVDLFCGGCAVTHAAMCLGRYERIIINDVDWRPVTLFMNALAGKYADERRWISREEFHRLKDTDPYVAYVWSFGNNGRDYLYGEDIEPFKRALHYAIYFDDVEPARAFGLDLSWVLPIQGERKRYLAIKHFLQRGGTAVPFPMHDGMPCSIEADTTICRTENAQSVQNAVKVSIIGGGGIVCRTYHEKETNYGACSTPRRSLSFKSPHGGGGQIDALSMDYRDVHIPDASVIYCDPPYKGTQDYDEHTALDHEAFYDWCGQQTQPVFISEYDMPRDRFRCIAEFAHRSTLSASANNAVTERLFVPRHQDYIKPNEQLSLF